MVEHPPADPVASLDAQDVQALLEQLPGGDEAGDAGADDHDVDLPRQASLTASAPAARAGVGRARGEQQPPGRGGGAGGAGGEQVTTRQCRVPGSVQGAVRGCGGVLGLGHGAPIVET